MPRSSRCSRPHKSPPTGRNVLPVPIGDCQKQKKYVWSLDFVCRKGDCLTQRLLLMYSENDLICYFSCDHVCGVGYSSIRFAVPFDSFSMSQNNMALFRFSSVLTHRLPNRSPNINRGLTTSTAYITDYNDRLSDLEARCSLITTNLKRPTDLWLNPSQMPQHVIH